MTDDKRKKIIDMIGKLSAIANPDSNAFQGEISNASAKMLELMDKYSIGWDEIHAAQREAESKEYDEAFETCESTYSFNNVQAWHWELAKLIARVTHTKHYRFKGHKAHRWWSREIDDFIYEEATPSHMAFFGVSENAEIASSLYSLWVTQITSMARKATNERFKELIRQYGMKPKFRASLPEEDNPRFYRSSWITGCLDGIREALNEQEAKRTADMTNAIMVYMEAIEKRYAEIPGMSSARINGNSGHSGVGYNAGLKVGKGINLAAASRPVPMSTKLLKG